MPTDPNRYEDYELATKPGGELHLTKPESLPRLRRALLGIALFTGINLAFVGYLFKWHLNLVYTLPIAAGAALCYQLNKLTQPEIKGVLINPDRTLTTPSNATVKFISIELLHFTYEFQIAAVTNQGAYVLARLESQDEAERLLNRLKYHTQIG